MDNTVNSFINKFIPLYIMNKVLISIFIIVLSFGSGFFLHQLTELILIKTENVEIIPKPEIPIDRANIINREKYKPEDLDFSIFWEVWNKIEKAHPDLAEEDKREKMLNAAIRGMVGAISDQHTEFLNREEAIMFIEEMEEEFEGVGMHITMDNGQLTVVSPLKGTPAYKAGILAGDKIMEIDGESTVGITLMRAVSLIRGPVDTEVRLLILRDDKEIEKNIIRGVIVIPTAELTFLEDGKIAHIELFSFRKGTFEQLEKIADSIVESNATSIILDLRNNSGGLLHSAVQISGLFLEQDSIVVIQDKRGKEIISRTRKWQNPTLKDYNMVILVNGGTASASEILAGALNYHRNIKLIGETTAGKGSVQELKELRDGSMLKITVAYWLLPNRDKIEGNGLVPDIEIKNSIKKLVEGIDCQLNKAIKKLKSN